MEQATMKMQPAVLINESLAALPTAKAFPVYADIGNAGYEGFEKAEDFQAVKVTDSTGHSEFVYCPTTRYKIVQHQDAFRPIVEGLTQAGRSDFRFLLKGNTRWAKLQLYCDSPGHDGVSLGFEAVNSYDGSSVLRYGVEMNHKKKYLTIVGYRQVCSNGMKIEVPLDQAEFIRPEVRERVLQLLKLQRRFLHTTNVNGRIAEIQHVVEAVSLLQEPVAEMIRRAQEWKISDAQQLDFLIRKHVGKRMHRRVREQYAAEDDSLWGLYNAITYIASHDSKLRAPTIDRMQGEAAAMLREEIVAEVPQ